jgi:asparagine synthase (glutamine-hydrolysing)
MEQAMAYWGPDGGEIWNFGSLGLGHLAFHSTPESIHETQPLVSTDGKIVLTASARLDNRDELCAALDVPAALQATTPDSTLISSAYQKWGRSCLDHLQGDWAFAIWDASLGELFIARDRNGVSGLYYYASSHFFAFASSMKGLLALEEVPCRLNERRLARLLVVFSDPREENGAMVYEDVYRLLPANYLVVSSEHLEVGEYWRLEDAGEVRLGSDEEYVAAFVDLYKGAVKRRMRSRQKVGVSLSGGLDSSSVLTLAAGAARDQDRRMAAYTSVPCCDPQEAVPRDRMGDEWPLAHAASEFLENVDHHAVTAVDISPLQGIEKYLDLYEQASHAATNFYWVLAINAKAREDGVGVLLSGQRGNATVSWPGGISPALAQLMVGKLDSGWRTLREWRSKAEISWAGALKSQVLRPLLRPTGILRSYLPPGRAPWVERSAIHPEFAHRMDLLRQIHQARRESVKKRYYEPQGEHFGAYNTGRKTIGSLLFESGARYDLDIRDPTIDQSLLEFCFGIPEDLYQRAGEKRWLIRKAMQGLLPPQLLSNPLRGLQSADVAWRLLAHPEEMESVLRRLEVSPIAGEYLDLPTMRGVWASIQKSVNVKNSYQCRAVLLKGIMAGLFLLRFEGD